MVCSLITNWKNSHWSSLDIQNKFNADGTLARHKACLVAKGYNQRDGIDFLEVFSLVAKMVNVKVLLTLATSHSWFLAQLDVHMPSSMTIYIKKYTWTFLSDITLRGSIYLALPSWLLHKSIYGLKQASCQWNIKFTQAMLDLGFT